MVIDKKLVELKKQLQETGKFMMGNDLASGNSRNIKPGLNDKRRKLLKFCGLIAVGNTKASLTTS